MPIPKSLKRFFAVLEPGSPASKHQLEGGQPQQHQQQQQHTYPQDKKSSGNQTFPRPQMATSGAASMTTGPAKKPGQPDASYLLPPTNKPLSNTQAFWMSQGAGGDNTGFS